MPKFSVFPKNFRYFRCSSHSTLHAPRFTLHTSLSTLHSPRFTLHASRFTLFPSPSGESEGGFYSFGYNTLCPS